MSVNRAQYGGVLHAYCSQSDLTALAAGNLFSVGARSDAPTRARTATQSCTQARGLEPPHFQRTHDFEHMQCNPAICLFLLIRAHHARYAFTRLHNATCSISAWHWPIAVRSPVCLLQSNTAKLQGCAVYLSFQQTSFLMTDNIYANNTAGTSAGALYLQSGYQSTPNVTVANDVFLVRSVTIDQNHHRSPLPCSGGPH